MEDHKLYQAHFSSGRSGRFSAQVRDLQSGSRIFKETTANLFHPLSVRSKPALSLFVSTCVWTFLSLSLFVPLKIQVENSVYLQPLAIKDLLVQSLSSNQFAMNNQFKYMCRVCLLNDTSSFMCPLADQRTRELLFECTSVWVSCL